MSQPNCIKLDMPKLVFFVWNIFFRWWIRTLQGGNWMSGSLLKIQQGSLHIRLNLQAEGHTADSQTKIAQWILYQEIIKYALAIGKQISTFDSNIHWICRHDILILIWVHHLSFQTLNAYFQKGTLAIHSLWESGYGERKA